jgi:hypothetical protein
MRIVVAMTQKNNNHLVKSVSISCVTPKKYTKNCALKYSMPSTDFCAVPATKITVIMTFVSFANKSTPVLATPMTTISGSAVISVIVGYFLYL